VLVGSPTQGVLALGAPTQGVLALGAPTQEVLALGVLTQALTVQVTMMIWPIVKQPKTSIHG
jgi:hypothetical protein